MEQLHAGTEKPMERGRKDYNVRTGLQNISDAMTDGQIITMEAVMQALARKGWPDAVVDRGYRVFGNKVTSYQK